MNSMTSVASGIDFTFDALETIEAQRFDSVNIKNFTAPSVTSGEQLSFHNAGHDDGTFNL